MIKFPFKPWSSYRSVKSLPAELENTSLATQSEIQDVLALLQVRPTPLDMEEIEDVWAPLLWILQESEAIIVTNFESQNGMQLLGFHERLPSRHTSECICFHLFTQVVLQQVPGLITQVGGTLNSGTPEQTAHLQREAVHLPDSATPWVMPLILDSPDNLHQVINIIKPPSRLLGDPIQTVIMGPRTPSGSVSFCKGMQVKDIYQSCVVRC